MSDARTVIAKWLGDETHVASGGTNITTATPDTRRADAILAALAEAGLVIVPREPSLKMCWAGEHAKHPRLVSLVWKEMVEAANEQ